MSSYSPVVKLVKSNLVDMVALPSNNSHRLKLQILLNGNNAIIYRLDRPLVELQALNGPRSTL
jgi:hypothetical protein